MDVVPRMLANMNPRQRGVVASTIRWSPDAHELVTREAEASGVSFSQYVREAALVRAAMGEARRHGTPLQAAQQLWDALAVLREG